MNKRKRESSFSSYDGDSERSLEQPIVHKLSLPRPNKQIVCPGPWCGVSIFMTMSPNYLEDFRYILDLVLQKHEPIPPTVQQFRVLSLESQMLFVRLYSRKVGWLRIGKLKYAEISDIAAAINELINAGFIFNDCGKLEEAEEVLNLLLCPELRTLAKMCSIKVSQLSKEELVQALLRKLSEQMQVLAGKGVEQVVGEGVEQELAREGVEQELAREGVEQVVGGVDQALAEKSVEQAPTGNGVEQVVAGVNQVRAGEGVEQELVGGVEQALATEGVEQVVGGVNQALAGKSMEQGQPGKGGEQVVAEGVKQARAGEGVKQVVGEGVLAMYENAKQTLGACIHITLETKREVDSIMDQIDSTLLSFNQDGVYYSGFFMKKLKVNSNTIHPLRKLASARDKFYMNKRVVTITMYDASEGLHKRSCPDCGAEIMIYIDVAEVAPKPGEGIDRV